MNSQLQEPKSMITINNKVVTATNFAFDNCHKIYICDSGSDEGEARDAGYSILPIADIQATYEKSCQLRFISNWQLTERYAAQCEDADFGALVAA